MVEGWEIFRLVDKSKLKARIGWQGLTTSEYLQSGYSLLVTGTDFNRGSIDWKNCFYVSKARFEQDKNIQIKNGDILITKDGTIGKTAFVENLNTLATLNSGIFVIRPNNDGDYDCKFVFYILQSSIFKEFLDKLSAGSTINHLYQKDFIKFLFKAPVKIEEQIAISKALSDIDNLILSLEKLIEKKKSINLGIGQELLSGKKRLDGHTEEWEKVRIKDLVIDMSDGPFGSNLKTEHYTMNKEARIIQLSNIGENGWVEKNTKYTTFEHAHNIARCIVTPGEVVIAKMMPAGRAIICPNNEKMYVLSSDAVRVTLDNNKVNTAYFVYTTKSRRFQKQIAEDIQGSTRVRTSISKLKKNHILLPPMSEQKKIALVLEEMHEELIGLELKLSQYRQIKQGMMQELLTGRIRLI